MSIETPIKLEIISGGTIGGGICEILSNKKQYLNQLIGSSIEVKTIAVRDTSKPHGFSVPEGCEITEDSSSV
jgi:homoserine dehydrogenase